MDLAQTHAVPVAVGYLPASDPRLTTVRARGGHGLCTLGDSQNSLCPAVWRICN
jgi:hypothetical protein